MCSIRAKGEGAQSSGAGGLILAKIDRGHENAIAFWAKGGWSHIYGSFEKKKTFVKAFQSMLQPSNSTSKNLLQEITTDMDKGIHHLHLYERNIRSHINGH